MAKIYLAGGMRSNWQDQVISAAPLFEYIDPRTHGLSEERSYTFWDLEGVRFSDYLFAYLESDNPSGQGMCVEIGFAAALNKKIIFVDGQSGKYFGMCRAISDVYFTSLEDGIALLQSLSKLDERR